MAANIFFLILTCFIVVLCLAQVRNQKMREKYAALWIFVSIIIVILVSFPHLLFWVADFVGIEVPVNLLFLLAITMLIGICLHLTLTVSKLGEETRVLAEEAAILREQLQHLEDRVVKNEKNTP